jgi:superfamily II DNA or RNA helicase
LIKLLTDNGSLPSLKWRSGGSIADALNALRGGVLPELSDGDAEFVDDEEVVDSDYVGPEDSVHPDAADKAKAQRASEETIRYIIESQLASLRAKWFRDGVPPVLGSDGGQFFKEIKQTFEAEVEAVTALQTPWWHLRKEGKEVPPSPMQKYIAWRLTQERVVGNWSGTGAGKTDSAGLAAYAIGSLLTLVLAVNSTVLGWKEQIEETFPGCRVFTDSKEVQRGPGCFLVVNYEQFQGQKSGIRANKIVALKPDFIVLDEVQMIKQRAGEVSSRSVAIRNLITQLPNARVLGMSATPVINELREGISLLEAMKSESYPGSNARKATIINALSLFKELRSVGVRYSPKYEQHEETTKLSVQRDDLLSDLLGTDDILPIEQVLLPAKLDAVKDKIKPGTVIYVEYVEGIVDRIRAYTEALGYSVAEYVGDMESDEREVAKNRFIAGEADVLIGSRAISVGVDGLQKRCTNLIFLSLPWTHAAYVQTVGRVYRQGGTKNVEIQIPQVVVGSNGGLWSWDEARWKHIESKRTLAECATDGVIPNSTMITRSTLTAKAISALRRLEKKAAHA